MHNCCPTCRFDLGNIRCLALEKVAESLELPCKYQSLGCHDIFPYYGKLKHEQHCRFRPYNCPYAGSECSVTGDIPTLVAHLKDDHQVDMHDGCTFNHRYVKSDPNEVENATWMLTVSSFLLWYGNKCEFIYYGKPYLLKEFTTCPLVNFPSTAKFYYLCRCLTALDDNFAYILRLSSLAWHWSTWLSYGLWVMMTRQRNSATVWKLVLMDVGLYGKESQGASVTATGKFVTARMGLLFRGTWLSTFLVEIGQSWSWGLLGAYGKKNEEIQRDDCTVQNFSETQPALLQVWGANLALCWFIVYFVQTRCHGPHLYLVLLHTFLSARCHVGQDSSSGVSVGIDKCIELSCSLQCIIWFKQPSCVFYASG